MSCIFCQAEMQIPKTLSKREKPFAKVRSGIIPVRLYYSIDAFEIRTKFWRKLQKCEALFDQKMVLHYIALSAIWQDQVLNTLAVNKYANGLKARALVHRKNNLTGTKSSVKLSTDGLAWKYDYSY